MTLNRCLNFLASAADTPINSLARPTTRTWTDHVLGGLKAMGLGAVVSAGLLGASPVWAQAAPAWQAQYMNEASVVLGHAIQDGMLDRMPNVVITTPQDGESLASWLPGMTCRIEWQLDDKGRSESLDPDAHGPDSLVAGDLFRQMSLLHEAGHCLLGSIQNPLRGTGLPQEAEQALNQWVLGPNAVKNPFGAQFNESGADCLGLMEMLAQNHFSPASIDHLNAWYAQRRAARLKQEFAGQSWNDDPHATDFAIKHLIDHLDEVRHADPSDYKNMALTFASQGFIDWLNPSRSVKAAPGAPDTAGPEALEALIDGFQSGGWFGMCVGYQMTLMRAEQNGTLPVFTGPSSDARQMATQFLAADQTLTAYPQARVMLDGYRLVWRNITLADQQQIGERLHGAAMDDAVTRWKRDHHWNALRTSMYDRIAPGYLQPRTTALPSAVPANRAQTLAVALESLRPPSRQDLMKKLGSPPSAPSATSPSVRPGSSTR